MDGLRCNELAKKTTGSKHRKIEDGDCYPIFTDKIDMRAAYILKRVKQTQVEMMRDRGLTIPEEELFLIEKHDEEYESERDWERKVLHHFLNVYTEKAKETDMNFISTLSNVYNDPETDVNTVVVYLCRTRESSNITPDEFKNKFHYYLTKYYESGKPLKMVFISEVSLNKKEEIAERLNSISCQFFLTEHLLQNPTKHMFYYPHELLSEGERREILSNVSPNVLPKLRMWDPIRRYYDWPLNGIVRIRRTERYVSTPAPESVAYRYIVK